MLATPSHQEIPDFLPLITVAISENRLWKISCLSSQIVAENVDWTGFMRSDVAATMPCDFATWALSRAISHEPISGFLSVRLCHATVTNCQCRGHCRVRLNALFWVGDFAMRQWQNVNVADIVAFVHLFASSALGCLVLLFLHLCP